jgi:hypothetical protein
MKRYLFFRLLLFLFLVVSEKASAQYMYDSVSFEIPTSKIIIDSAGNSIWQIGTPGKSFFDSAHSGTKAILTDTLSSYPSNDTSVFIYVIRNPYTQTCFTSMEFWHKYDMDTLTDIGIIEASYDGGNSWVVVNDTNEVSPWGSYFWWDSDYHAVNGNYTSHPLTTSGKSDGWILSRFNWQWWMPVRADTIIFPPDSLMIKFTFISDSIETGREGWMIDDILTASAEMQLCSGIEDQPAEKTISVYPNPFSLQTTLKTNFLLNYSIITIYDSFGNQVYYTEDVTGNTITFYRKGLPPGLYLLSVTEKGKLVATKKLLIVN